MTSSDARDPEHDDTTPRTDSTGLAVNDEGTVFFHGAPVGAVAWEVAPRLRAALAATPDAPGENPYARRDGWVKSLASVAWDEGFAAGLAAGRATADTDPPPSTGLRRVGEALATGGFSELSRPRRASGDHPAEPDGRTLSRMADAICDAMGPEWSAEFDFAALARAAAAAGVQPEPEAGT